jgi:tRNA-uridine 2-sulfurtransferase
VEIDAATNRIVLGGEEELLSSEIRLRDCNWIPWDEPPPDFRASARIRHRHPGAAGIVRPGPDRTATIILDTPARAVTPGQACVLYDGDLVLGGGWIAR